MRNLAPRTCAHEDLALHAAGSTNCIWSARSRALAWLDAIFSTVRALVPIGTPACRDVDEAHMESRRSIASQTRPNPRPATRSTRICCEA